MNGIPSGNGRPGRVSVLGLLAVVVMSLQGCAELILRDRDGTPEKAGKIAARIVLGVTTLGMSEMAIEAEKERERDNMMIPVTERLRQADLSLPGAVLLIGTDRRAMDVIRINLARWGVRVEEAPALDVRLGEEEEQRDRSLALQADARDVGRRQHADEAVFVVTTGARVSVEAIAIDTGDTAWIGRAYAPGRNEERSARDEVVRRLTVWALGRVWCRDEEWNEQTACARVSGGP